MQKYNLIDTQEKLKELDKILMDGSQPRFKLLAVDTETNGLALYKTTVIGVSIAYNQNCGFYIPFLKWVPDETTEYTRSYKKVKYEAFKKGHLECVWTGGHYDEFVTPKEYNLVKLFPLIPALLHRWLSPINLYMWNGPFDINHLFINIGLDLKENLFLDGGLMAHCIDENFSVGLKQNAEKYKDALGINPHIHANLEKQELGQSIIKNGGTPTQVWRANLEYLSKYACSDAFFTFGLCEKLIQVFRDEYGQKGLNWFFRQEVMPLCKEVVIDMKRNGAYVDVPYFEKLSIETQTKMDSLEDLIIEELFPWLVDFDVGESLDSAISNQALIKRIIVLENLSMPTVTKKGEVKESLAKGVVKKVYAENPHWLWGYVLGEDEIKYDDAKILAIKKDLYLKKVKRRHRFNIGSADHLRWLFCEKLGLDNSKLPQTDSATPEKPKASMAADILEEFMLPKFNWVSTIMSWKKLQKMQSTYIKPVLEMNIDSWLYVEWKQNGTISGRFSCAGGYNLQTLPRVDDELEALESCEKCGSHEVKIKQEIECIADLICEKCGHHKKDIPRPSAIKRGFIAPPGHKIVNADYSSLEPRCFAVVSNEQAIKDVYLKNLDLYSQVYCELFDVNKEFSADSQDPNFLKKIAKAKRTWIKPIVLGIPYGAERGQVAQLIGAKTAKLDFKTRRPLLDEDGRQIMVPDTKEGQRIIDAYLGKFTSLKKYMDEQDSKATLIGVVETLVGRKRHLPFAKKINDILVKFNIDYLDLKDAPTWTLKKALDINYTSFRGNKVSLTAFMAQEIQEAIGFGDEKFKEKGNWLYIRSLLKSDLNGSKNTPIQGLAGHITNKGMLDATRAFKKKHLNARVALQVHDEITVYSESCHAEDASKELKVSMEDNEFTALLDIPMIADPVICTNLKEAK